MKNFHFFFIIFLAFFSTCNFMDDFTSITKLSNKPPKSAIFQGSDIIDLTSLVTLLPDKNVEMLTVSGSFGLTTIGDSRLSRLPALQTLDLSYNSITFQHQSEIYAFYLTNLTELNLSHNKIGSTDVLMTALRYLPNLRSLYLNHNRNLQFGLYGFPASLDGLEILDLSYCHIWNLDDNVIANLRNLKTLHLEGNSLSIIPQSLCTRQPTLQLYLAKTHIDKSHQKDLQENCTVGISFKMPVQNQIVDNDPRNSSVWFYLFIVAIIDIVIMALYLSLIKNRHAIREKVNRCLEGFL